LQGVSINTHSVISKQKWIEKKNLYTSLILSHHHSHIHTSFFISLSKQKKHIEGGRRSKENILYTLSFSLIITHTEPSHFYFSWKKNTKILEKEAKIKKERKGEEISKIFEGTSLLIAFFFLLIYFFQFLLYFFKSSKNIFSHSPLTSHETNFKIIQNMKNLNKKIFKNIKKKTQIIFQIIFRIVFS